MGSGHITKNRINLELIEIIQFCLKMETIWGQHEDNVETTWGQCGDHRDVETMWGQCGDNMGTMWRQHEDNVETT